MTNPTPTRAEEKAAPVAEDKPTKEQREMAQQLGEAAFEKWRKKHFGVYASYPLDAATAFNAGWKAATAAAHKAALEAEARCAEMREACERLAGEGCLVPPDGGSPTEDERKMCEDIALRIRALPSPSGDRFTQLLEAASAYIHAVDHHLNLGPRWQELREALAAFPQPEKQP